MFLRYLYVLAISLSATHARLAPKVLNPFWRALRNTRAKHIAQQTAIFGKRQLRDEVYY